MSKEKIADQLKGMVHAMGQSNKEEHGFSFVDTPDILEAIDEVFCLHEADAMSELKPCPFCGSTDLMVRTVYENFPETYFIFCFGCGVEGVFEWTKAEAVEAWNRRANKTTEIVEPEIKPCPCGGKVESNMGGIYCTECDNHVSHFEKSIKEVYDNWNSQNYDKEER